MIVLIVDDSALLRDRLASMLAELQEKIELVGEARDPIEAIDSIRKLKPDAVILDIRMPGGSGIDVLKSLKTERPEAIAIMLTSYPYPQYRQKCREAGADFFFDKSTEFHKVREVFQQLIGESTFP